MMAWAAGEPDESREATGPRKRMCALEAGLLNWSTTASASRSFGSPGELTVAASEQAPPMRDRALTSAGERGSKLDVANRQGGFTGAPSVGAVTQASWPASG
jgi:hypothetical protein